MAAYAEWVGQDGELRTERSRAVLMRGRERVRDVLEPHLGAVHALERANNIAQALAPQDARPEVVAFEMLRQVPGSARQELAIAVRQAWQAAERDELLAERRCLTADLEARAWMREPVSEGRACVREPEDEPRASAPAAEPRARHVQTRDRAGDSATATRLPRAKVVEPVR